MSLYIETNICTTTWFNFIHLMDFFCAQFFLQHFKTMCWNFSFVSSSFIFFRGKQGKNKYSTIIIHEVFFLSVFNVFSFILIQKSSDLQVKIINFVCLNLNSSLQFISRLNVTWKVLI